jgi:hypothetical protein
MRRDIGRTPGTVCGGDFDQDRGAALQAQSSAVTAATKQDREGSIPLKRLGADENALKKRGELRSGEAFLYERVPGNDSLPRRIVPEADRPNNFFSRRSYRASPCGRITPPPPFSPAPSA